MRSLTLDAREKTLRGKFKASTKAERDFYKALRRVAQASGSIVDSYVDLKTISIKDAKGLMRDIENYSKRLGPWAKVQSAKLLDQVQKSNKRAYTMKSREISTLLESNMNDNFAGQLAKALMDEQVALIQSIPIEAAQRAQKIAYEAALEGTRAQVNSDTVKQLQKELGLTTEVAESRAKLIAITETARANASINQARAMSIGSRKYRWHNSGDGAVRDSHKYYKGKKMEGQIFSWDNPPTLDDGTKGHPGTFPRCRCYAEPVFED